MSTIPGCKQKFIIILERAVERAIDYNHTHDLPTDYWSLQLPKITQQYVPKLLALAYLIKNHHKYNPDATPVRNRAYFTSVTFSQGMSINKIAQLTDTNLSVIAQLNAGYCNAKHKIGEDHSILIPVTSIGELQDHLTKSKFKIKSTNKFT